MGARFEGDGGGGIAGEQAGQRDPVIEHGPFVEDLAGGIEDADVMAAIAKIEADGEPAGKGRDGRGSGNDGRSVGFGIGICFCFHRQIV